MNSLFRTRKARVHTTAASTLLASVLMAGASQGWAFSLDDVAARAEKLAGQEFAMPQSNLPPVFREMKYADYQRIRFREDHAHWVDEPTPFKLFFYHQGMHFDVPVKINEITANGVRPIEYNPEMFDFSNLQFDKAATKDLGFAGFKVLYPLNKPDKNDELITFLGASYLRALGKDQWYGLSLRGLAIDTAMPAGEEFPRFSEFWVEHPAPDRRNLVIYALLDSPRATGAYRMVVTPGKDTSVEVHAKVYLRAPVGKLGIAPLTSMFLYGPNDPAAEVNYRPAIHDSNGLAIHAGNGEWIWRPLNNPRHLSVSTFTIENPKGFGLMQRGHDFSQYEDLEDRYDLRPSGWVEILDDWGKGKVELVEIPTRDETNDNIVAFWTPEQLPERGEALELRYRVHFTIDEAALHHGELAWVQQTRRSTGEVKQANLIREPDGSVAYVIDFQGPALSELPPETPVQTAISVGDNGELVGQEVHYHPVTQGRRLTLRVRVKDPARPLEMRAALMDGERALSETWSYQVPAQ